MLHKTSNSLEASTHKIQGAYYGRNKGMHTSEMSNANIECEESDIGHND